MRDSVAQSTVPTFVQTKQDHGTLMWIGDRLSTEFQSAFQFCDANVAQIATRRDFDDALQRPASSVRRIIVARGTRQPLATDKLQRLQELYPQAIWLEMKGPLCTGDRSDPVFCGDRCCWNQWPQKLPEFLRDCGGPTLSRRQRAASVAVIAASFAEADPLMELIVSENAVAIWCRTPNAFRVRGVDAIWWDDTVAAAASCEQWRQRIALSGNDTDGCQHAWLVNSPSVADCQQAKLAGIGPILSKPFDIDCLLQMVAAEPTHHADHPSLSQQSRFAA